MNVRVIHVYDSVKDTGCEGVYYIIIMMIIL